MAGRGTELSQARRETRSRLIEATAKAAVARGYRAMTVAHILDEAALSRRTFYQHFTSKEDAFLALYESVVVKLVDAVRNAVESTEDPVQRLSAGIDAYLQYQQEGGDIITMLQAEAANPVSMLSPLREKTLDQLVGLFDAEIHRLMGATVDPLIYRCLYLGMEALVIHLRKEGPFVPSDRDRVAAIMKPMFLSVLAAIEHMPQAALQD